MRNALTLGLLLAAVATAQKMKIENLPEAVKKTVQAQTQGAVVKAITKETEAGKTAYEVETTVAGHARDFVVDSAGSMVEVEEAVELSAVPAGAKAAIEKWAAGRKLTAVESVNKGKTSFFEATITKAGKESVLTVNQDGSVHK